jgi:hypothetical protein
MTVAKAAVQIRLVFHERDAHRRVEAARAVAGEGQAATTS